jgi:transposase-like protein
MKARRPCLGERIEAVERIRAGAASIEDIARQFGLPEDDVRSWLAAHANDRTVSLAQLRGELAGEAGRLLRHAQVLRQLIAHTDRTFNLLHARLLSRKLA